MGRKEYYIDSDNPDTVLWGLSWRGIIGVIVAVLLCAGLGWAGWAVKVATSDVKGAGDAQIKINSADNRIQSQELFQDLFRKVKEYDRGIDTLAEVVRISPTSFNRTNLTGQILACQQAIEQYNAETDKISSAKWLSDDLPYKINENDPATDCKETAK